MTFQIIDNVLPKEEFENIKNFILHSSFPWNMASFVSYKEESLPISASYYFTHQFWFGFDSKQDAQIFATLLDIIECRSIIRIKANLYPSTETVMHHMNHIDYDFSHRGAILYLNTNNGMTVLEDETEIESVENRLLLFDPSKLHHSTTCSDEKYRCNVNFNFF